MVKIRLSKSRDFNKIPLYFNTKSLIFSHPRRISFAVVDYSL